MGEGETRILIKIYLVLVELLISWVVWSEVKGRNPRSDFIFLKTAFL